jgi:hypothetical protein
VPVDAKPVSIFAHALPCPTASAANGRIPRPFMHIAAVTSDATDDDCRCRSDALHHEVGEIGSAHFRIVEGNSNVMI